MTGSEMLGTKTRGDEGEKKKKKKDVILTLVHLSDIKIQPAYILLSCVTTLSQKCYNFQARQTQQNIK